MGSRKLAGSSLLICKADGMRQGAAFRIALIGQLNRRLQHASAESVDIKLAAREPMDIRRVRGVEQQQRRLPAFGIQVDDHALRLIVQAKFEAGLARDVFQKLGVEFQKKKFIRARFQHLHLKTF